MAAMAAMAAIVVAVYPVAVKRSVAVSRMPWQMPRACSANDERSDRLLTSLSTQQGLGKVA